MVTGLAQTVEKSDSTINCRKKTPLGLIHAVTITKRLTYSLNLITWWLITDGVEKRHHVGWALPPRSGDQKLSYSYTIAILISGISQIKRQSFYHPESVVVSIGQGNILVAAVKVMEFMEAFGSACCC